jgi:hypothetical protein
MNLIRKFFGIERGKSEVSRKSPEKERGWRKSRPHLLLLSKFLSPTNLSRIGDYWTDALQENYRRAIDRLIEDGALIESSLDEKMNAKFKVSDLRRQLKERGLKVSGRKRDLIERLIDADRSRMKAITSDEVIFQCSKWGAELANKYLEYAKEERENTERMTVMDLDAGNYRRAIETVAAYEAKQVFSRGINIDWGSYDTSRDEALLFHIFHGKPRILGKLTEAQLNLLRTPAALSLLGMDDDKSKWLPPDLDLGLHFDVDTAIRMLIFYANYQVRIGEIGEYQAKMGVVKAVKISAVNDNHLCENCRRYTEREYRLSDVPELPHHDCTSVMGCRCIVQSVVELET